MGKGKVLLVSMPFGALDRQALGLSLLKAALAEAAVPCDVRYLTFPFAEFVGSDDYRWVSSALPYTAFAGDWLFTPALYGERPEVDLLYVAEVLRGTWGLDDADIARILRVRRLVAPFLDHCLSAVPWDDYALVGFTSTFEQNIASLALARRVREAHPGVRITFGGANWEGEMGQELHARFPFVDLVCSGEAESSFPEAVRRLLAGRPLGGDDPVPGIVYREGGISVATGPAPLLRDLDRLPVPDFADYFAALDGSTVAAEVTPTLLFETSRGCWWGAKSHCTFCGLNGGALAFRSKSAGRALAELDHLVGRWGIEEVEAVDNILDMRYFADVLPVLAVAPRPVRLFYETKANLTRDQVRLLARANVRRIQPGIESLSDRVLGLMRKGTTALKNVQLLKWCREEGIWVDWNILYGFPGETAADYAAMLPLLRAVRFLQPPGACGPVRLDRFSPYFDDAAAFGITDVRPMAPYRFLYPFPEASLRRIAYYFEHGYRAGLDPAGFADPVIAFVREWQRTPEPGSLAASPRPDGALVLHDTRANALRPETVLAGPERAAYLHCDALHSVAAVTRHLRAVCPEADADEAGVRGFLDSLVAAGLMVTDGSHYLSLALLTPPVRALMAAQPGPVPLAAQVG